MDDATVSTASDDLGPPPARTSRHGEWVCAAALIGAIVSLSSGGMKFYPFAPPNFFLARVQQYCRYSVVGPDGSALPLHEFGLGDFYTGQAGIFDRMPWQEHGAVKLPATGNIYGVVLTGPQLVALVQQGLRGRPALPYVVVSQQVVGAVDDQGVGVIAEHRFQISAATATSLSDSASVLSGQKASR
jgi:hypothetical protein